MPEITDEEMQEFQQYRRIGTVQDLQKGVFERAAHAAGFNSGPLERLFSTLPQDQFTLVMGEDGKPMVKEGELDPVPLKQFAEEEWSDFLPSLKADRKDRQSTQTVQYVRQAGEQREVTAKSVGKKLADSYIMQKYGAVLKSDTVN